MSTVEAAKGSSETLPPKEGDARCAHQIAAPTEWPWLPTQRHGHLSKHPWCIVCGQVAAQGSERALDQGGLINHVATIIRTMRRSGVKVTETQTRLIMRELHALDAADRFGLNFDAQRDLVHSILGRFTGVRPDAIASYTHAH